MKTVNLNSYFRSGILMVAVLVTLVPGSFCQPGSGREKLKVATCQFPVTGDLQHNAGYIRKFIVEAAGNKADIVHFPEAALTGYPPEDIPSFDDYDWEALRAETRGIMSLAKAHHIWVVMGSAHYLDEQEKPMN